MRYLRVLQILPNFLNFLRRVILFVYLHHHHPLFFLIYSPLIDDNLFVYCLFVVFIGMEHKPNISRNVQKSNIHVHCIIYLFANLKNKCFIFNLYCWEAFPYFCAVGSRLLALLILTKECLPKWSFCLIFPYKLLQWSIHLQVYPEPILFIEQFLSNLQYIFNDFNVVFCLDA